MHPDLEDFLEDTFANVQPSARGIGHVVIEPDYDVAPDAGDRQALVRELAECLDGHTVPAEISIGDRFPTLQKYLRRISLHADPVEGSWVEVEPPGNWI